MTEMYDDIRDAVQKLCARFPGEYWREKDRERAYPTEFVNELTESGFMSVLIPEEFGGSGLGAAGHQALLPVGQHDERIEGFRVQLQLQGAVFFE